MARLFGICWASALSVHTHASQQSISFTFKEFKTALQAYKEIYRACVSACARSCEVFKIWTQRAHRCIDIRKWENVSNLRKSWTAADGIRRMPAATLYTLRMWTFMCAELHKIRAVAKTLICRAQCEWLLLYVCVCANFSLHRIYRKMCRLKSWTLRDHGPQKCFFVAGKYVNFVKIFSYICTLQNKEIFLSVRVEKLLKVIKS